MMEESRLKLGTSLGGFISKVRKRLIGFDEQSGRFLVEGGKKVEEEIEKGKLERSLDFFNYVKGRLEELESRVPKGSKFVENSIDFIESVEKWAEENGRVTDKQRLAILNIDKAIVKWEDNLR